MPSNTKKSLSPKGAVMKVAPKMKSGENSLEVFLFGQFRLNESTHVRNRQATGEFLDDRIFLESR